MEWRDNLVEEDAAIRELLVNSERIAVLGIKPESHAHTPAYYVPAYLVRAGYEVLPVPVYFPEVREILGKPVFRRLEEIPGEIDLTVVFRKPADIPQHLPDLLSKRPKAVWFQLGIRNDEVAEALARAGIRVVQDHCIMVDHRRLV